MSTAFITTVTDRCRMCYTCVRECPVKAIRITDGQAKVVGDRCIACGNCVRVCSQHAKLLRSAVEQVREILRSGSKVAACLAPSFPAEFPDIPYTQLIGMIRALGFHFVAEVAFGADLVAREYSKLMAKPDGHRYIATNCPAVIGYVERYYPDLVDCLAPIVSPMIAIARVLKKMHGDDLKIVFIGPCIAKKVEASELHEDIDAVLMFPELRLLCNQEGIYPSGVCSSDFDPPHGSTGALFPVSRGILQAADLHEDIMTGEVVATQGRRNMLESIKEFEEGDLGARLLEILCCDGCITGPGVTSDLSPFHRRRQIRLHVCHRMKELDQQQWRENIDQFSNINLRRGFTADDQRIAPPAQADILEIMHRMGKFTPHDELNCGACGYDTCVEHAVAVYKNLAESEMCLPNTIDKLRVALREVEESHGQLAAAQEALVQSEKLASMGQLAAGIAHEVNNPLGVVLMYSHLLLDDCEPQSKLRDDLVMITEQADRCKKIVAGLLHFARQNKVCRVKCDVCRMVDRTMRIIPVPDNVKTKVIHNMSDPVAEIDQDQIVQVLTNLMSNAIGAMENGGTLTVRTSDDGDRVRISVSDTGVGIPPDNVKKIFDPFFTTKEKGKGTGLGLAVTYGIIKMHSGEIRVDSQADPNRGPTGTTFTVTLPRTG